MMLIFRVHTTGSQSASTVMKVQQYRYSECFQDHSAVLAVLASAEAMQWFLA